MAKHRKESTETAEQLPRTLVIGVYTPGLQHEASHYFEEFSRLVQTANIPEDNTLYIKLRSVDNAFFFTKGKLQEINEYCQKHDIEHVVVSTLLTSMQERNLEDILGCKVYGRAELILNIFQQAAHSAEGKIQVEMAILAHLKTRLAGRGKDMAQQEGYVGARGPGESGKESLRRYYEEKIRQAKKRLVTLAKSREVQRKQRLRRGIDLVCLVGYTNAGKSSMLNLLTKSDVLAQDKLFATLDTTTRELFLPPDKKVLLSDTVGFISQLPHNLIEAFKSTLDELRYARLLVHVIDASHPAWHEQVVVVKKTLKDLGVTAPVINVFNKIDLLEEEELAALQEALPHYQPAVLTNTTDKTGTEALMAYLQKNI